MTESTAENRVTRPRGRPRAWDDKTEQNTIKSLDRAIAVLEKLGSMEGAALSELADALGQSPATVYRVLITLEGRGYVEFDERSQIWNVGAGAYLIGAKFLRRTSLVEQARPIMRDLMEATGETANLGIERDGNVMFVSQVETRATIRAFFPPGAVSAMHSSGIGKALLAQWDDDRLSKWLDNAPLERFTEATLAHPDALRDDLLMTKKRGYAFDAEERNVGMRCIAAAVFNVYGEAVAGISVSGPITRISDAAVAELGQNVQKAAADLTRAMGGHIS